MPEHHDSVDSDVEALSGIELLDRVGVRRSPFATGADFSFMTSVPDSNRSFTKEPSIIERKAYRNTGVEAATATWAGSTAPRRPFMPF